MLERYESTEERPPQAPMVSLKVVLDPSATNMFRVRTSGYDDAFVNVNVDKTHIAQPRSIGWTSRGRVG